MPVICCTADGSPAPKSPWPTTIPPAFCCPAESFMVFLQVLADVLRGSGFHLPDESRVENLGCVHPGISQQMVERDDFRDHRDVLSRVQKDGDLRQLDLENRRCLDVQTRALDYG